MLISGRLPHFDSRGTRSDYPRAEDYESTDRFGQPRRSLQFANFLSPLEYPYSDVVICCFSTPGGEYAIFPCNRSRDISWRFWSGQKDEV